MVIVPFRSPEWPSESTNPAQHSSKGPWWIPSLGAGARGLCQRWEASALPPFFRRCWTVLAVCFHIQTRWECLSSLVSARPPSASPYSSAPIPGGQGAGAGVRSGAGFAACGERIHINCDRATSDDADAEASELDAHDVGFVRCFLPCSLRRRRRHRHSQAGPPCGRSRQHCPHDPPTPFPLRRLRRKTRRRRSCKRRPSSRDPSAISSPPSRPRPAMTSTSPGRTTTPKTTRHRTTSTTPTTTTYRRTRRPTRRRTRGTWRSAGRRTKTRRPTPPRPNASRRGRRRCRSSVWRTFPRGNIRAINHCTFNDDVYVVLQLPKAGVKSIVPLAGSSLCLSSALVAIRSRRPWFSRTSISPNGPKGKRCRGRAAARTNRCRRRPTLPPAGARSMWTQRNESFPKKAGFSFWRGEDKAAPKKAGFSSGRGTSHSPWTRPQPNGRRRSI